MISRLCLSRMFAVAGLLLTLGMVAACGLGGGSVPTATPASTFTAVALLPVIAFPSTPAATGSNPYPAPTQPAAQPTAALPTAVLPTPLPPSPTSAAPARPLLAVVFVSPGETLQVRQAAGTTQAVVDQLAYNATALAPTGNETTVGEERWVEINRPAGGSGWVSAAFLSEYTPAQAFCADGRLPALLDQLKAALASRNGEAYAALVSPAHGVEVSYLRGGTVANYSPAEARWVFTSTYEVNWGLHPGSGLEVKGTFQGEVLPRLLDVWAATPVATCNDVVTGGTTYTFSWPDRYANINFYSLYRPGASGDDLNWRTWLVGVEYVNGQPYVVALVHLMWEP